MKKETTEDGREVWCWQPGDYDPVGEIIEHSVEAVGQLGANGKWRGLIAYSEDYRLGVSILATGFVYNSEQAAKDVMLAEIKGIRDFAAWCEANPISQ
ncbi:MAG: hypothetical protein MN733_36925 [Nitrososphaera sp.]|nr:hypothetical protein [Nitrososphaera sp.]